MKKEKNNDNDANDFKKITWNFNYEFNGGHHSRTKHIIYKIENILSSKIYIGQTRRMLHQRWNDYKYNLLTPIKKEKYDGSNIKLKHSVQKHYKKTNNVDFLKFSIIEIIESNDSTMIEEINEKLSKREIYWINEYRKMYGTNKVCNVLNGGTNHIITNDDKNKISESKKRFYQTETGIQLRKKLSNVQKGRKRTEEEKQKMSKSRKGLLTGEKHPLFGKTGALNPMFGKKHSEESKQKMSDNKKGLNSGLQHQYARIYDLSLNPLVSPIGEKFSKIECLSSFCKEQNLHTTHLRNVFKGKNKSHKGWKLESTFSIENSYNAVNVNN